MAPKLNSLIKEDKISNKQKAAFRHETSKLKQWKSSRVENEHKLCTRRERIKEDDIPCLLSTSINAVNAVPPTVHSSTGAFKLPT